MKEHIITGKWTEDELSHLLRKSALIREVSERIHYLSGFFLGLEYEGSTLSGDINKREIFVLNLRGVDCFTFLDYIESMRLSGSFPEFKENLKKIRYRNGKVSYKNRNHFFTDWRDFNSAYVQDVTELIGRKKTRTVTKSLNKKENGTYFLKGISPRQAEIHYIPAGSVDNSVTEKLKTGDYAGICSDLEGLDVSHAGIIIKDRHSVFLRHASSDKKYRKVIDQDFRTYISDKPGVTVLRAK